MQIHPPVELISLDQQLSSNAVMGQRIGLVNQSIPQPAH
jgi:hypothetical protein